jgi:hypothetical protein
MSWRPAIRCPLPVIFGLAFITLLSAAPEYARANQTYENVYFLPLARVRWAPPCGGVPYLISPADGSQVSYATMLVLDGGYRDGDQDLLEIEVSRDPDFRDRSSRLFKPAGKRWELNIWVLPVAPGLWYWRASVWCQGDDLQRQPTGYEQSPYSQVWSFMFIGYPYPIPRGGLWMH